LHINLIVPYRISLSQILTNIHNKGHGKIEEHGRSEGEKRGVYEEYTDIGSSHTELFSQARTHPKSVFFEEILDFIYHTLLKLYPD
jgi:hypothetical protein